MRRLGLGLLVLFPQAGRQRYETEMRELLAQQTIRPRTLADLVRAVVDAHLHPNGLIPTSVERMRNTVGTALCCWIAFVVCGSAFAKLTEDRAFAAAGAAHPLLSVARLAIELLAALSAAVVLLGGGRLIAEVSREAWTDRRRPVEVPSLANAATGPFGVLSTATALAVVVVLMATITGFAAITSARGLRARRAAS